ncbi:MAG: redox-regulated ATPase YchF [Clostridiales bacterium]|nr:redox-regulated ATPase YchF [Clostridiales bacterium]
MKLGIVGLPNVGKSTLFNAMTRAGAEAANYPFSTKESNIGVVSVPDERLNVLTDMFSSARTVHTAIEFFDIAGLVRGASKGDGLGNKFLGHIREAAAIVHVVRCFDDDNVMHVDGEIDPARDIETINLELILADMEVLERRIEKTRKALKGDKGLAGELALLERLLEGLLSEVPVRAMELESNEHTFVSTLDLLTFKPVIYAANINDAEAGEAEENAYIKAVREIAEAEGADMIVVAAKVEAELSEFDDEERQMFLEELGIRESGLDKLIRASYHLLDLVSFLTAGKPETRAWTIRRGSKAPQAAGKIHSDFERGFIRAETIAYEKLIECGSMTAAKEKGLVRSEGKEYIVQDGDVIHFLFNV